MMMINVEVVRESRAGSEAVVEMLKYPFLRLCWLLRHGGMQAKREAASLYIHNIKRPQKQLINLDALLLLQRGAVKLQPPEIMIRRMGVTQLYRVRSLRWRITCVHTVSVAGIQVRNSELSGSCRFQKLGIETSFLASRLQGDYQSTMAATIGIG